jgi:hypothetical protein
VSRLIAIEPIPNSVRLPSPLQEGFPLILIERIRPWTTWDLRLNKTMAAIIQLRNSRVHARFDGEAWESNDSFLAGELNDFWSCCAPKASTYHPNPIQQIAELTMAEFHADLVQEHPPDLSGEPDTVY